MRVLFSEVVLIEEVQEEDFLNYILVQRTGTLRLSCLP